MYVLVVASQKGGSGKTTLSGHLAVEAQNAGFGPVALIDTDPQGSLSQWWDARKETTPFFVTAGLLDLGEAVEHLRSGGVQLVIIDTPPAITVAIDQAIAHADLVILPTRPSPHDLRALGATVDIAERHHKPLIFVINAATPRARITGEAAIALSQHGTVAPVMLHHRVDFAASMVDGRTVGEVLPKCASAREVRELWAYVQDRLARVNKDAMPATESAPMLSPSLSPESADVVEEAHVPATMAVETAGSLMSPSLDELIEADTIESGSEPWRSTPTPAPIPVTPSGLQAFGKRRSERYI